MLTSGSVVVDNGPDNAQAQVDAINMNRCVNVLPNIDMYFAAAGKPDMTAIRPTVRCFLCLTSLFLRSQRLGDRLSRASSSDREL